MKVLCAVAAVACLLGCESTTYGPIAPWGTVGGLTLVPNDAFFLASVATNGDYNFTLVVADQPGYCSILQQNLAGYPANITYAIFIFSNPVGTGQLNPGPGPYPISAAAGASSSAQATFGSVTNCTVSPDNPAATAGSVVMSSLSPDATEMTGNVNDVVFGSEGSLSGTFDAPLCDTGNSVQGASQCFQ